MSQYVFFGGPCDGMLRAVQSGMFVVKVMTPQHKSSAKSGNEMGNPLLANVVHTAYNQYTVALNGAYMKVYVCGDWVEGHVVEQQMELWMKIATYDEKGKLSINYGMADPWDNPINKMAGVKITPSYANKELAALSTNILWEELAMPFTKQQIADASFVGMHQAKPKPPKKQTWIHKLAKYAIQLNLFDAGHQFSWQADQHTYLQNTILTHIVTTEDKLKEFVGSITGMRLFQYKSPQIHIILLAKTLEEAKKEIILVLQETYGPGYVDETKPVKIVVEELFMLPGVIHAEVK